LTKRNSKTYLKREDALKILTLYWYRDKKETELPVPTWRQNLLAGQHLVLNLEDPLTILPVTLLQSVRSIILSLIRKKISKSIRHHKKWNEFNLCKMSHKNIIMNQMVVLLLKGAWQSQNYIVQAISMQDVRNWKVVIFLDIACNV